MKRAQFKLFTLCGLHLRSRQFTAATNTSNMRLFSLSSFVSGLLLGVGVSLSFSYKPVLHASWRDYSPFILSDVKKSSYNEKYSGSVSSVKESENSQAKENKGEDIESSGKAKQHVLGTGFIADAVEMVMDSVVNISVECDASNLFSKKTSVSNGSGFAISKDGKFLTNAHVVSDFVEGSNLLVTDSQGVQFKGILYSMDLLSDLAVVKIVHDDEDPHRIWKPVKFGKNDNLRPGDWVISIGNPLRLNGTVTAGIVSARRRKNTEIGGLDSSVEYIQTDCVIHTGSSGGPLINLEGEVIGINTKRAEEEGIGFAIRADNASGIIDQLMNKGHVVRPWIGVQLVSLSQQVKQQLKLNISSDKDNMLSYETLPEVEKGVLVAFVQPKSPAYNSGLQVGDVLVEVNGIAVGSSREMLQQIGYKIGEPMMLKVKRAVPLDMDWDGRVRKYETISTDIRLTPEVLDVEIYGDKAEYLT